MEDKLEYWLTWFPEPIYNEIMSIRANDGKISLASCRDINSPHDALRYAFNWFGTTKGDEYWEKVYRYSQCFFGSRFNDFNLLIRTRNNENVSVDPVITERYGDGFSNRRREPNEVQQADNFEYWF